MFVKFNMQGSQIRHEIFEQDALMKIGMIVSWKFKFGFVGRSPSRPKGIVPLRCAQRAHIICPIGATSFHRGEHHCAFGAYRLRLIGTINRKKGLPYGSPFSVHSYRSSISTASLQDRAGIPTASASRSASGRVMTKTLTDRSSAPEASNRPMMPLCSAMR